MVRTDHKELKQQNILAVSANQAQKAELWRKEIADTHRPCNCGVSCNKRRVITILVPDTGQIVEAGGTPVFGGTGGPRQTLLFGQVGLWEATLRWSYRDIRY